MRCEPPVSSRPGWVILHAGWSNAEVEHDPPGGPMKMRLDLLLVSRGLAPSRERAQAMVLAGLVIVDGKPSAKPGTQVSADAAILLREPDHPYVGRGGLKLAHALDRFQISVRGREALDI